MEAFWSQKLARHLIKTDPSQIESEQLYQRVVRRLYEVHLFAIDRCLHTCVFTELNLLLEATLHLWRGRVIDRDRVAASHILRRCWTCYLVLGNEEILSMIQELSVRGPREADRPPAGTTLFLQSIPAPETEKTKPLAWPARSDDQSQSFSDYAGVHTHWLALTIRPWASTLETTALSQLTTSQDSLETIAQRTRERLSAATQEPPRISDVMTLSLCMWCQAFRTDLRFLRLDALQHAMDSNPDPAETIGLLYAESGQRFGFLVELCGDSVLLAEQIRQTGEGARNLNPGRDFLTLGLARELCAVAAASLMVAGRLNAGWERSDIAKNHLQEISDVLQLVQQTLGYSLPAITRPQQLLSSALIQKTDGLLQLCEVIWRVFGPDRENFSSGPTLKFQFLTLRKGRPEAS